LFFLHAPSGRGELLRALAAPVLLWTAAAAIVKAMLAKGPAKKVTIFLNEDTRHHLTSLHDAIMTFLLHKGVSGATATRGMSGFGSHHTLRTAKVELLAEHLPIRIEFVEAAEKVEELLPTLYEMVTDGLIEVQDTTIVKQARKQGRPAQPMPHRRDQSRARMLRVFFGEADKWQGEPLHEAIVKKLRMMEIAGATVYRGILGYGAKGHQHKRNFLHISRDLPIMITVIDSPEKISVVAEALEAMLEDGLLVISDVDIVRVVRSIKTAAQTSESFAG
jgi:PII-like signaling protein